MCSIWCAKILFHWFYNGVVISMTFQVNNMRGAHALQLSSHTRSIDSSESVWFIGDDCDLSQRCVCTWRTMTRLFCLYIKHNLTPAKISIAHWYPHNDATRSWLPTPQSLPKCSARTTKSTNYRNDRELQEMLGNTIRAAKALRQLRNSMYMFHQSLKPCVHLRY